MSEASGGVNSGLVQNRDTKRQLKCMSIRDIYWSFKKENDL